jgi:nucleoside-diphosphate-sugar epimerase
LNVLVTGATGFIGRELMAQLLEQFGAEAISCLVRPSTKPAEVDALARYQRAGVRIIEGDLDDPKVSRDSAPAVDVVFHLAANIDTASPETAHRVNYIGTERLLDWLGHKSRNTRVVYSSSIAVLDRNGPARKPLNESSPQTPRTAYGRTKLRGEEMLQARAATDGYTYTIFRLATVYGPGGKPGGLFDLLFKMTARRKLVGRINWPGRTSIVHVADVAAVMIGLARRTESANEIYCVANAEAPTVGELAQRIGQISGFPVSAINPPAWIWSIARVLTSSAWISALAPSPLRLELWRASLIVDHGFWFDTSKLQSAWAAPFRPLEAGLTQMASLPDDVEESTETLQRSRV